MGRFWKVFAAVAIVVALGVLPFLFAKHENNSKKDPTMIGQNGILQVTTVMADHC